MMGGTDILTGKPINTVEVLDLKTRTWTESEPLQHASWLQATALVPKEWFNVAELEEKDEINKTGKFFLT